MIAGRKPRSSPHNDEKSAGAVARGRFALRKPDNGTIRETNRSRIDGIHNVRLTSHGVRRRAVKETGHKKTTIHTSELENGVSSKVSNPWRDGAVGGMYRIGERNKG